MTMTTAPRFIIGTQSGDAGYSGVLRSGRRIVFECGHSHRNRDISTGVNGTSARDCVTDLVRTVRLPTFATSYRDRLRGNAERAIARMGMSAHTAARWREWAREDLATFEAQRTELAAILNDAPVFGQADVIVLAPPAPTATCTTCGLTIQPTRWVPQSARGVHWQDWHAVRTTVSVPLSTCADGNLAHPEPEIH
jgi:hypothetical protein